MRTVGDATNKWGSSKWSGTAPDGPHNASWQSSDAESIESTILDVDPGSSEGASVGARAAGTLRLVVEALNPMAGGASLWGTAKWGHTDTWGGGVGEWVDISARVRGIHWEQGTQSPGDLASIATATLTLENLDGDASPWATTGDFAGAGSRTWLRSGLVVRFGILCNNIAAAKTATGLTLHAFNPWFTGTVDTVADGTNEDADAYVTVECVELTSDLGTQPDTDIFTNDGEQLSGVLVQILEAVGWERQKGLQVPDDDVLTRSTTVTSEDRTSWEVLQYACANRYWQPVANGRGRVQIVERRPAVADTGLVFANKPTGTQYPVPRDGITPYSSTERVLNTVQAAYLWGDPQTEADSGSVRQFGAITDRFGFPRTDLFVATTADITSLQDKVLRQSAWDDLGIETVQLNADMDAVRLPAVLAFLGAYARDGYYFLVRWTHPSGRIFSEQCVVEGLVYDIVPAGGQLSWTATLKTAHAGEVSGT